MSTRQMSIESLTQQQVKEIQLMVTDIIANVEKVIVGKREVIELLMISLLCEGHVLAEDVPGVGKTMLARAVASSIGCKFRRIQCTPDLLPSDITGVSVFNQKISEFEFLPGPIMSNIVLADEINRATPRTQSCFLECMGEGQVTMDGITRPLPRPFLVLATQNPIEYEGTFPLPEAQMDRFLMRIHLGYPGETDESQMLLNLQRRHPIEDVKPAVAAEKLLGVQTLVREVFVEESLRQYIVKIINRTRNHPEVALGSSPRGSLAVFKTAQAWAALKGRNYVIPDDIKYVAPCTLGHRLILKPESTLRGITSEKIFGDILQEVAVPVQEYKEGK